MQIVTAVVALGLIGLAFGFFLALAARFFAVKIDPRVEAVKDVLPNVNCGACGYAGCVSFAEAVVRGEAEAGGCIPGGVDTANAVAEILGIEVTGSEPLIAVVHCMGDSEKSKDRFYYDGIPDCSVADTFNGGFKACPNGCLGLGNCVRACPFEAISMDSRDLPLVDPETCTGCGLCVTACPRGIIKTVPLNDKGHFVLCNSHLRGKSVTAACSIGCIACRACVKACPREAIEMVEQLAVIDLDKCDDCGKCVPVCPPGVIFTRASVPKPGAVPVQTG